jgi:hypothetical protein
VPLLLLEDRLSKGDPDLDSNPTTYPAFGYVCLGEAEFTEWKSHGTSVSRPEIIAFAKSIGVRTVLHLSGREYDPNVTEPNPAKIFHHFYFSAFGPDYGYPLK